MNIHLVLKVYEYFAMMCTLPFLFRWQGRYLKMPVTSTFIGMFIFAMLIMEMAGIMIWATPQLHNWTAAELCGPMLLISAAGLWYFAKRLVEMVPKVPRDNGGHEKA